MPIVKNLAFSRQYKLMKKENTTVTSFEFDIQFMFETSELPSNKNCTFAL